MSNRQLDDANEEAFLEHIMGETGLTADELDELEYSVDENTTNDGIVTGYNVTFDNQSNLELLKKATGSETQSWVRIGSL